MIHSVRLVTILTVISIAYQFNFLAFIDPQEPKVKRDPIKFFGVTFVTILAQWITVRLSSFNYSIRLGPSI